MQCRTAPSGNGGRALDCQYSSSLDDCLEGDECSVVALPPIAFARSSILRSSFASMSGEEGAEVAGVIFPTSPSSSDGSWLCTLDETTLERRLASG